MTDLAELLTDAADYIAHTDQVWAKDLVTELKAALESLNRENQDLTEAWGGRAIWGVRVGTWPPQEYQTLELARYYAARPLAGQEGYSHKVVTRRTFSTPWVEVSDE